MNLYTCNTGINTFFQETVVNTNIPLWFTSVYDGDRLYYSS